MFDTHFLGFFTMRTRTGRRSKSRAFCAALLFAFGAFSAVGAEEGEGASERSAGTGKPPVVAKIESAQLPAWVERNGTRAGAKPGWAIYPGDTLITGDRGRLLLVLSDDARLTLGESAQLEFTASLATAGQIASDPRASFLRVSKGAFNFTAAPVPRDNRAAMTIGLGDHLAFAVLGGHVWGKSDKRQDTLLLIDGAIDVVGDVTLRMDRPQSVLVKPRKTAVQPPAPAPAEKIALWLAQTEFHRRRPTLTHGGNWTVSLLADRDRSSQIVARACRLQELGYPSEIVPAQVNGKQWQRLLIQRFASKDDAQRFVRSAAALGSEDAWVVGQTP